MEYELIITICNEGFAEIVNEAAKSANSKGATIIHGKGSSAGEEKTFLGITISQEKDLLLIVSSKEEKMGIMNAIISKCGTGTKVHAVCFSLPVDEVVGLSFEDNLNFQAQNQD
jgi:nitrogen regulatory protein PII